MPAEVQLPDDLFEPLARRIASASGIRIPKEKRWLLSARVRERMSERAEDDVRGYVHRVLTAAGTTELGHLVEAVRVGETQFFRHRGQIRAIRRVALPEIAARRERERRKRVRVWSAGCASGEEPYTLAMLLERELPASDGWTHSVLATDLSRAAIESARRGCYPMGSVRTVPGPIASWAIEPAGDEVRVTDRVRRLVRFEHQNLLSASYPRRFDLVLCRNVLIYFDRATQRQVLGRLAESVVPGGWLALGYAERLGADDGQLTPIRTDDGVLYRRAAAGEVPYPAPPEGRTAPTEPLRPPAPPRQPARTTVPPPLLPALSGELEGAHGRDRAHGVAAALLGSQAPPVLDLRELRFADEGVARVLARAAHTLGADGRQLTLVASAQGTVRFLRRHGIAPPAVVVPEPPREDA